MTTPISEDFRSYAIPLRDGPINQRMIIPENQRRMGENAYVVTLPEGFHTIQLLWKHDATAIHVRHLDGTEYGRNIAVLPGGVDAKPVTVSLVVAPGGEGINFLQQYPVTAEKVGTPLSTLGVNLILNPAKVRDV